jgi:ATP-dependent protease ClpP protease subunit
MQTRQTRPQHADRAETSVLLKRSVSLRGPLTRHRVFCIISRVLYLAAEDPSKPLLMEINSRGGTTDHAVDLLRIMDKVACPVVTFCRGEVRGPALVLAAHGRRGCRAATPDCRFSLWSGSDKESLPETMMELLRTDVAAARPELTRCIELGAEFDAQEALRCGLIDSISPRPHYPKHIESLNSAATVRT